MRFSAFSTSIFSLFAISLLSGCSGFVDSPGITVPQPIGTGTPRLAGEVYGGQAPLVGAHVYAFSSNVTANAGPGITGGTTNASKSLITATPYVTGYPPTADSNGNYYITTDSGGFYEISSATGCIPGSITYLYSVQGNGGGGNNTAAGEMVALGVCPTTGTNAGTLLGSLKAGATHIHMNEISTVAAAYALAGYASDATHIGAAFGTASGTSPALTYADTLAVTGIQNAVNNAAQLYNYNYNTASSGSGDPGAIANATTPNGNGTVPQTTLDSLGNSLGGCVNVLATSSGCTTLLGDAKSGGTTGTTPTDTATAAINIAHNPTANVTAIYNNAPTTAIPFGTTLTAAPLDWSVSIVYTGGGLITPTYSDTPATLAIDAAGNAWIANYSTSAATVSEFSPQGVSLATYSVGNDAISVTIDGSGNAWTANFATNTLSKVSGGTVSTVSSGLGLSDPDAIAFDGAGNMFIANAGANTVVKATSAGVYTTKTSAKLEGLDFTVFLSAASGATVGTGGLIYGSNESDKDISTLTNTLTGSTEIAASTGQYGGGSAIDSSGIYWEGIYPASGYAGGIARITGSGTAGSIYSTIGSTYYTPQISGVAADGSSNIWMADSDNGTVYEMNESATVLSGSYGFVPVGNTTCGTSACTGEPTQPNAIAVDGSGDVWYTDLGDANVRELIGIATPVATPIAYATAQRKLGARP